MSTRSPCPGLTHGGWGMFAHPPEELVVQWEACQTAEQGMVGMTSTSWDEVGDVLPPPWWDLDG